MLISFNARDLLLLDEIEAGEFRRIKEECNEKITRLEAELNEVMVQNSTLLDIRPIAEAAIKSLELLDKLYDDATIQGKRYLVGMLYPEKLTFDGVGCRT
jgi:site-specific DNA recombinase